MKQIFYDPDRKRWRRLRRIMDVTAVVSTIVLIVFFLSVVKRQTLPELLLPAQKRNYKALKQGAGDPLKKSAPRPARRKTHRRPSEIPLNGDEGLRAAFYTNDEASYSSLKAHIHQIDLLFPDWLHVFAPNGDLIASTSLFPVSLYNVVDKAGVVHGVDPQNKVQRVIVAAKEDMEVFPMLNDYNPRDSQWHGETIGKVLKDPIARENLHHQIDKFLSANPNYHGICLDFEEVPDTELNLYAEWIGELHKDLHAKNLRIYVDVETSAEDWLMKAIAKNSDGIILMNYDQHEEQSGPGPIAAQDWFEGNLSRALKVVPKQKLICGLGNYGYFIYAPSATRVPHGPPQ
jgi:spore germination protein YaaH